MNGVSLRLRLALTGAATIVLALAVADYGLTQLFERHAYRTLADSLDAHVREIVGAIEIDGSGAVALPRPPADPGFDAARLVQSFARGSSPTDLNLVLWRLAFCNCVMDAWSSTSTLLALHAGARESSTGVDVRRLHGLAPTCGL